MKKKDERLKTVLAFIAGGVMVIGSFSVIKYLLAPMFTQKRQGLQETSLLSIGVAPSSSSLIPETIVRRDVDQVPEQTEVTMEILGRPEGRTPPEIGIQSETGISGRTPSGSPPSGSRVIPSQSPATPLETTPLPSETIQPPPPPEAPTVPPPPSAWERPYRVRVGVFENPKYADEMMAKLSEQGYKPDKKEEASPIGKKRWRIYVGAYDNRESAEKVKQELTDKGFSAAVEEVPETSRE